ncbi:MAG: beta-xylosidase [Opitutaceae bacterium]
MNSLPLLLASLACSVVLTAQTPAVTSSPFPVRVVVDAAKSEGELKRIWRYFGADEPNYATMKDGQKLLGQLGELAPKQVYFRAHNLLTSGDGTPALKWGSTNAYTEDGEGRPVYDWRGIDRIFDSYLQRGVRPLVQIGFMPEALSTQPQPYRHEWRPGLPYNLIYTGWTKPPKDYAKWEELAYRWALHSVERYGAEEVSHWWWEVWNEANNQPHGYWGGSAEDFRRLHDHAIAGVRRAFPAARVGGPHTAGHGGQFMKDFLEHCLHGTNYATGQKGTPLDFVAFHAKGSPTTVDGHVRMGISAQLKTIDTAFTTLASYPELKGIPVIIGESDPEGCAACQGPQMAYRNGTMYSSYTAAVFARKHELAARHGINLEGALTWAFTFEDQPYFAGFRQVATNGLAMPVLNVFRMYARMGRQRIEAMSTGQRPLDRIVQDGVRVEADVGVLASRDARTVTVMVWHYHDDDLPGPDAAVEFTLSGLAREQGSVRLEHLRIDQEHSNSYAAWLRLGSPVAPSVAQYAELEKAGMLAALTGEPATVPVRNGTCSGVFVLPRQAVSLLRLTWD